MEWEAECGEVEEGGHGIHRAFTLLHPAPSSPKKGKKTAQKEDAAERAGRDLLLAAYPPVTPGETTQRRLERAAVCEECLNRLQVSIAVRRQPVLVRSMLSLRGRRSMGGAPPQNLESSPPHTMQEAVAATDIAVFKDLLQYVRHAHQSSRQLLAATPRFGRAGKRPLPAGLVLAGGVNSADHAQTFPALETFLKAKVTRWAMGWGLRGRSPVRCV
jgi:Origin recognition complex (ORC) subunit 3 N-terminus